MRSILLIITTLIFALPQICDGAENNASARRHPLVAANQSNPRIIVKRRANALTQSGAALAQSLRDDMGLAIRLRRGTGGEIEVLEADATATPNDIQRLLRKLQSRSDVVYAVIDQRRHAHAIPSDALYPGQWYLQDTQPAGIAANLAWDTTTGGSGTVVAVLDTGVRFDHPDLLRAAQAGKLLPGFDFVSGDSGGGFLAANDGDGWDSDPSDPGDWIDSSDQQKMLFKDCAIENSSWHGTRVTGMIGAASNNGIGIAGTSWGAWILPVRVLGKCGGFDSDILSAMRWAAGLHVSGVPDNLYPAKILNLSLGSTDPCSAAYQSAIQELATLGVLVVVSAGNEGGPVDAPANCSLAVGVAGVRHVGTKVGFSSLGPEVSIASPAGNCVNTSGACLFSLVTTYDIGTTIPVGSDYTNQFNTNLGTSFSAPLAAGVAALMNAVNGKLSTQQLRARMMEGAHAFPNNPALPTCHVPTGPTDLQQVECNCTTLTCGAGLLNASGAVIAAQRPIVSISVPATFVAGSTISLDASASVAACNRSVGSYQWTVVSTNGTSPPVLAMSDQPTLQVTAPLSGNYTLRVTATDNVGAIDSGDVVINSTTSSNTASSIPTGSACPPAISIPQTPVTTTPPVTPPVTPPSTSSHGGGAMQWYFLIMLAGVGGTRTMRRIQKEKIH